MGPVSKLSTQSNDLPNAIEFHDPKNERIIVNSIFQQLSSTPDDQPSGTYNTKDLRCAIAFADVVPRSDTIRSIQLSPHRVQLEYWVIVSRCNL